MYYVIPKINEGDKFRISMLSGVVQSWLWDVAGTRGSKAAIEEKRRGGAAGGRLTSSFGGREKEDKTEKQDDSWDDFGEVTGEPKFVTKSYLFTSNHTYTGRHAHHAGRRAL